MKNFYLLGMFLVGCGLSSRDNELVGQVKKVVHHTPILCPDYSSADVSLGVMRGGVGSMSSEDAWLYLQNSSQEETLRQANETGALVKITYDVPRIVWCVDERWVTKVELVK